MNLKAFLWFVYKLKFHVITALAFNVNKIYWGGTVPFSQLREGVVSPRPREMSQRKAFLCMRLELGKGLVKGGRRDRLANTLPFLDALPGGTRLTHGFPPFKLWAKLEVPDMAPSCDDHPSSRLTLWSLVSFVLGPSLSPSGA